MWLGNKNGWHFISIDQLSSQAVTCFMQICFTGECTSAPYLFTSICFLIQLSNYKWMDTLKGKDATNFNKTLLSYCEIYNRKVKARGCRELQYRISIQKSSQTQISWNLVYRNLFHGCAIVLKFCTEYGSDTAVLYAKFQNNCTTEMDVMDEWDLSLRWGSGRYPTSQQTLLSFTVYAKLNDDINLYIYGHVESPNIRHTVGFVITQEFNDNIILHIAWQVPGYITLTS